MAAAESHNKKRKVATESHPKAKKARKSDDGAATQDEPTKASQLPAEPTSSHSAKPKRKRKQAADFFSDDETPAEVEPAVEPAKSKKTKKSKAAEPANGDEVDMAVAPVEVAEVKGKSKKAKKGKKPTSDTAVVPEIEAVDVSVEAPEAKDESKKGAKKGKKVAADEIVAVLETVPETQTTTTKKSKKNKQKKHANASETEKVTEDVSELVTEKEPKHGKKSKKEEQAPKEEIEEVAVAEDSANEDEGLDDQTAALLAGFESDRDESDLEKEDEDFDDDALPNLSKKKRKELEQVRTDAEPGVIYLGRIPHGFFEPQMKKYFSQFGTVTRLRLSRNKKTGASKHYAFVEFANADVANIVAQTMHNYLMFGHILQCRVIPSEQVHAELFKGANERFKVDPRNKKAGNAMARGAEREVWEKRVERENKKRTGKAKGLEEEFGYALNAPAVKAVGSVPQNAPAVEDGPTQQLLTEGEDALEREVPKKKNKKNKGKKRKSDVVPEAAAEPEVSAPTSKEAKEADADAVPDRKRKATPAAQNGTGPKKAKKAKA